MKEIVTGACLLGVSGMALGICLALGIAHKRIKVEDPEATTPTCAVVINLIALWLFIAAGFSGCGILVRGVIR